MPEFLAISAVFIVAAIVVFLIVIRPQNSISNGRGLQTNREDNPAERLRSLSWERNDYTIFIGVPVAAPTAWAKAATTDHETLLIEGYGSSPIADIKAFVVAYPNHQVVGSELVGLTLPAGFTELAPSRKAASDVLQLGDLEIGKQFLDVRYGQSSSKPTDRDSYSTSLANISREKIRVLRFAGYAKTPEGWKLSTVTRNFYSAEEFRNWYGMTDSQWISPGEAVTDFNNYGSPPVLWAYYCETESGQQFIAGAVLK